MSRVLIVSNRLPVTVEHEGEEITIRPSVGGLATGLAGVHDGQESLWIGWPGRTEGLDARQRGTLERKLAELRLLPVNLTDEMVEAYYERFSNGVVWPLFHYLLGQMELEVKEWEAYAGANRRFADAVARVWRPGDLIWVHDYQLMALPAMLRERLPGARIGFFLHIPFPAAAVLETLPCREQVLRGLLGADVVGFHTPAYVSHFAASILHLLGLETTVDTVAFDGRDVRLGSFPMGIDPRPWGELARDPEVVELARTHRAGVDGGLFVGIDRLDYTKGIPRRLLAFERLLELHPELRGTVRLIQVAVPSRESVGAYRDWRQQIEALVGRVHGAYATATWSPVHYLHRSLTQREVVALYLAADVMLVTPIRDGMNLVAKEFAAARHDERGVLVLSEFAGAAAELTEAVRVNPYDVGAAAAAYHRALTMPAEEQSRRMRSLRRRVLVHDARAWAESFLAALRDAAPAGLPRGAASEPREIEALVGRARDADHLILLLDYDGTLVPFAGRPELAAPDADLLRLLEELSSRPGVAVHLVSGRPRGDLDGWFGNLPIGLHAEHGLWSRLEPASPWRRLWVPTLPQRGRFRAILDDFADRTPGAVVEEKSEVLAWHWRAADSDFARRQANELRLHLAQISSNVGVEVVAGDRVIELRPHGLHKGAILPMVLDRAPADAFVVALGDDRTDEDLFASLPASAVAVHVGAGSSRAALRLATHVQARELLRALRS